MLVHCLGDAEGRAYIEQVALDISGPLDLARLGRAFQWVVDRHEALRTSFAWKRTEQPMQVIHRRVSVDVERWEPDPAEARPGPRNLALLARERARGIPLGKAPLMRICVTFDEERQTHILVWTHHHMIIDGWSVPVVLGEVLAHYENDGPPALPKAPRFRDYLAFRAALPKAVDAEFFAARLRGLSAPGWVVPALPGPEPTPPQEQGLCLPTQQHRRLSRQATLALVQRARDLRTTTASLVCAAWCLLTAKLSGASDVLLGLTTSGRPAELEGAERMVGLLINTLPLRVTVPKEQALADFVQSVSAEMTACKPHEWAGLAEVMAAADAPHAAALIEGVLVFENYPSMTLGAPLPSGLTFSVSRVVEETNYAFMLVVAPGDELELRIDANPARLDNAGAGALLEHACALLGAMGTAPLSTPIAGLSATTTAATTHLTQMLAAHAAPDFRGHHTVAKLEAAKERFHDRIAVIDAGGKTTYGALFASAEAWATCLTQQGVVPGDAIAVLFPRTSELVSVLLGIWLAGAAYVPLGARLGPERVQSMFLDASIRHVLVHPSLEADAPWLDTLAPATRLQPPGDARFAPLASQGIRALPASAGAYVLFTSGSTGRPKGVRVPHAALSNLLLHFYQALALGPESRFLAITPLTFDIAGLELWAPLLAGATLELASDADLSDAQCLHACIARTSPTHLQTTPSTLRTLLSLGPLDLGCTTVLVGGEALPRDLASQLLGTTKAAFNVYGPTETTIWSSAKRLSDKDTKGPGYVGLGDPIANTLLLVRDAHGGLLGHGVIGELCIAGEGLAEGYVGDATRTAQAFVFTEFGRMYRTGDRACRHHDGELSFHGRSDEQVKLRGHRIELGDVEAALETHEAVAQAIVVFAFATDPVRAQLVAFVRLAPGSAADGPALRAHVAQALPGIMVPSRLHFVATFPQTPNGKVHRNAMRAQAEAESGTGASTGVPADADAATQIVCAVFAGLLGRSHVGPDDDFFALGGHSLLATQLVSRIRGALGKELALRTLFSSRTPRALAVELLRTSQRPQHSALVRLGDEELYPLSFAQTRLWFIDQLEPLSAFYNIPAAVRIRGPLRPDVLQQAFSALLQRQETLRTTFESRDGVPFQRIHTHATFELPQLDLRGSTAAEAEAERWAMRLVQRPFDLGRDLPIRAALATIADDDHALILSLHHIAADGWSIGVLISDLVRLYDQAALGAAQMPTAALPALPIRYVDYARFLRATLGDADDKTSLAARQLAWHTARLEGAPVLSIPTDRPRPGVQRFRGARVAFELPVALGDHISTFARAAHATPFMVLLAVLSALLYRLGRTQDVSIGTPIAGRTERDTEGLIGFFVNTLVLRVQAPSNANLRELVALARKESLGAYENQDVPFERVVDALGVVRDRSRSPLFQAMLVVQNAPRQELSHTGLSFAPHVAETKTSKTDLEFTLMPRSDGSYAASLEYDTDLFEHGTAARIASAFQALLGHALDAPDAPVAQLPLLGPKQQRGEDASVLAGPWLHFPTDESVTAAFERHARSRPDDVAIIDDQGELRYGELLAMAQRVGSALCSRGLLAEDRVGIHMARGRFMLAAIYGAIMAGGAYVPIEPELPKARKAHFARIAGTRWILSDANDTQDFAPEALCVDARALACDKDSPVLPLPAVRGTQLAYVLFTSGSTGLPKGAMLEHRGVINRIAWQQGLVPIGTSDVVLHKTPIGFDVSVWELFWPLGYGARMSIVRPQGHQDPAHLAAWMRDTRVTVAHFVPTMLGAYLDDPRIVDLPSLRAVLCSGEALTPALATRFGRRYPQTSLHNLYGPTEASVDVTHHAVPQGTRVERVPIGRPVANTVAYVLDESGTPVPRGFVGELCVAGVQVARGYMGADAAANARFLLDPFANDAQARRMYRTGDLARVATDGELEFFGRDDQQVKVRGQRIELGEVESTLMAFEGVQAACAIIDQRDAADPRIVAYVTERATSEAVSSTDASSPITEHVASWGEVFERTYGEGSTNDDPTFDLRGWVRSIDGQAMHKDAMRAWVDAACALVLDEKPERVLEIGCGTGLVLFGTAPHVGTYVGTDIAPKALARVQAHATRLGLNHVRAIPCAAHELAQVPGHFDTVVLNSVVQYFPDEEHLLGVLALAIQKLPAGGRIVLGDVRNAALVPALCLQIELAQAQDGETLGTVRRRAAARAQSDQELSLHPDFFASLGAFLGPLGARVHRVEVRPKAPGVDPELGKYRYDVVIQIAAEAEQPVLPQASPIAPKRVALGQLPQRATDVSDWIRAQREAALVIEHIPNARLAEDAHWARLDDHLSIGAARSVIARAPTVDTAAETVAACLTAALASGRRATVAGAAPGADPFELRIELADGSLPPGTSFAKAPARAALVHAPRRRKRQADLVRALLRHASAHLPSAMVPSTVMVLDTLPLSASGKVLRSALPAPDLVSPLGRSNEPPRDAHEQRVAEIIEQLLGLPRVGRDDDFFALGGHSLLATRLTARLSAQHGLDVPLRWVFEARTVKGLAAKIAESARGPERGAASKRSGGPWSPAPLSHAQRRLYLAHALSDLPAQYNVPMAVAIDGPLNLPRLEHAIRSVVQRHAALRTRFLADATSEPFQVPLPEAELVALLPALVEHHDLSTIGPAERDAAVASALETFARRAFDLAQGIPFRAAVFRRGADAHVLALCAHHLVCDRWSMDVLLRDLVAFYDNPDAASALPSLDIDALDHAAWERMPAQEQALDAATTRVVAHLRGAPEVLSVCTDRPRKPGRGAQGARVRFEIHEETARGVRALAEASGCTPFAVFFAALGLVFRAYGSGDDIVVGTAAAGRGDRSLDGLVGMFVGTVPLRLRVRPDESFQDLLRQAAKEALRGLEDERVPLERVAKALTAARAVSHEPVVQAMLVLQNTERPPLVLPGAALRLLDVDTQTTKLDLTMFLEASADAIGGYAGAIEFATDIFDAGTVRAMAAAFGAVLSNAVGAPNTPCEQLELVDAEARARLLSQAMGPTQPRRLAGLFPAIEDTLAARGSEAAIVFRGTTITGSALAEQVARCAARLHAGGVVRGDTVAIALPRGPSWVAWALGCLALGVAFVPIPRDTPKERAAHMLTEAGAARIIVEGQPSALHDPSWLEGLRTPLLRSDENAQVIAGPRPAPLPSDRDLAYVLFTSGSTGAPKGVRVPQGALRNHMEWMLRAFPLDATDKVLFRTSPAFDACIWEVFLPLLAGVPMVIADQDAEADPRAMADLVRTERVTVMQAVPTILRALESSTVLSEMNSLRLIFAGGEAFPASLRQAMAQQTQARIVNLYGPTETTIDATFHVCEGQAEGATEPIGRPIDNVWALPLGRDGKEVPWGAPGELFVGGAGVALGYTHEESSRFRPDTLTGSGRMYSTGDLTRLRADGTLEYLGRSDGQLKIGGVRLETAEIEATLSAHPDVEAGVVALRGDPARLVAYVVLRRLPGAPEHSRISRVLAQLRLTLPPAGVPKQVVVCDVLPRTTSGKVHRAALPEPPPLGDREEALVPPDGAQEIAIAALFTEMLRVSAGAESDFFALGGDSILSLQLVARARARGIALSLRDVFEARTVRALAARATMPAHAAPTSEEGSIPLLPLQERLVRAKPEAPAHFAQAALLVPPDNFDEDAFLRAVAALVATHAALRSRFPGLREHTCTAQEILPAADAHGIARAALVQVELPEAEALGTSVPRACGELTASLAPDEGRVFHIGMLRHRAQLRRIFVTIHHFVVDTYSFRVLEDDLLSAYAQAARGQEPWLPPASATLRALESARSERATRSPTAPAQDAEATPGVSTLMSQALGSQAARAKNPESSAAQLQVRLDVPHTLRLLGQERRDTAPIEDALLSAFVGALVQHAPAPTLQIAIEGHGRNDATGLDTSRLVGWLTRIDVLTVTPKERSPNAQDLRRAVQDARRQARELGRNETLPAIGFNYLGPTQLGAGAAFAPAPESMGSLRAPGAERLFALELVAALEDGALVITLHYGQDLHQEAIIRRLAQATIDGLVVLGSSDDAKAQGAPVDASLSGVSGRDLSRIMKKLRNRS